MARMIDMFPRMIGVDLYGITRNLTYEDIVGWEAIRKSIWIWTTTCKAQPHVVIRCNGEDEEEEDDDKDIDIKKTTQHEEDEQPSQLELGDTNEMVRE